MVQCQPLCQRCIEPLPSSDQPCQCPRDSPELCCECPEPHRGRLKCKPHKPVLHSRSQDTPPTDTTVPQPTPSEPSQQPPSSSSQDSLASELQQYLLQSTLETISRTEEDRSQSTPAEAQEKEEDLPDICDHCHLEHHITECAKLQRFRPSRQREAIEDAGLCLSCLDGYAEFCDLIQCPNLDACKACPEPHHKVLKCGIRLSYGPK